MLVIPDYCVLMGVAHTPIILIWAPFGWPPGVSILDAFYWPVVNQFVRIVESGDGGLARRIAAELFVSVGTVKTLSITFTVSWGAQQHAGGREGQGPETDLAAGR
jgi:hypothetical protein